MRNWAMALAGLLLTADSLARAAGPRTQQDVVFSPAEGARTAHKLDIYAPASGSGHPVVLWIHGGGWRSGDKARVQRKPPWLNEHGFVLVSINYGLHPAADYKQQAGDVAQAVRWVRDHAAEFGGAPDRLFLLGHSAGAHLAALVGTDARYLAAKKLQLSDLAGVVLVDGACYDIPLQVEQSRLPRAQELYRTVFGSDVAVQRDASPIAHIAANQGIPPFLILHVAQRADSRQQSQALAQRLTSAGVSATVVSAQGKTHATINRELGTAGDAPSQAVLRFLEEHRGPTRR
jgi:acetyl esterase/lipase